MQQLLDKLRSNLLFIPLTFVTASILLAWITTRIESQLDVSELPFLIPVGPESARAVLATIAGATLTVAGIVFSLTAVTVQLAANQYTPRLAPGFLRDRFQQAVVGIVVGTFMFALLALAAVDSPSGTQTRSVSMTVGILLGLASVLGIILFIDRVGRRILVDDTMRRISEETTLSIRKNTDSSAGTANGTEDRHLPEGDSQLVRSSRSGWIRSIDLGGLLGSLPADAVIRLDHRVGDRVTKGEPIARVWGVEDDQPLDRYIYLSDTRDVSHDPTFGFRQLVDIALRALSTGVNDPTTAADVVRHMIEPLSTALIAKARSRVRTGENGCRVYLPDDLTQADYVRAAISEIRMAAVAEPYLIEAIVDALSAIHHRLHGAGEHGRCEPLLGELNALAAGVRESKLPPDIVDRMMHLVEASALHVDHQAADEKTVNRHS